MIAATTKSTIPTTLEKPIAAEIATAPTATKPLSIRSALPTFFFMTISLT
jgi:hypothetical protein